MSIQYRIAPSVNAYAWTNSPSTGENLSGSITGTNGDDIFRGLPGTHQEITSHATIDKLWIVDTTGNTYIESRGPNSGNGPNWSARDSVFNLGDGYIGIYSLIGQGNYCYNFTGNTVNMGEGDSDIYLENSGSVYYDQVVLGSNINAGGGDDGIFVVLQSDNIATWMHAISGGTYNMGSGRDEILVAATRGSGGMETATWAIQNATINMGSDDDEISLVSDDYGITDNCVITLGDGDDRLNVKAGKKGIDASDIDFGLGDDQLYVEATDSTGYAISNSTINMGGGDDSAGFGGNYFRTTGATINFGDGLYDLLVINGQSQSFNFEKISEDIWSIASVSDAGSKLIVSGLEYIRFSDGILDLAPATPSDTTPPTLQSTTATTNQLILTFSEDIQIAGGGALNPAYMTITVDGQTRKITKSQIAPPDQPSIHTASKLALTLSPGRSLDRASSISVSYNPPTNGSNQGFITDLTGNKLAAITSQAVDTYSSSTNISKSGIANAYKNLILTGIAPVTGYGNTQNNTITGNDANNILDGLAGADMMLGGLGDDTYVVDNIGDQITELASAGTDTVQSSIAYTLADDLENLTLLGSAAINGTGNSANNVLTGNTGANVLNGNGGKDALIGGRGNDTYIVDSSDDSITETGTSSDVDSVQASVSWSLGANLENLTLTGTSAIDGTGNALNNTISGTTTNNLLDGGNGGTDRLTGLTGADTFRFSARPSSFINATTDRITDFSSAQGDKIQIAKSAFGITASTATLSVVSNAAALNTALSGSAQFIYNTANGELHWNQNGITRGAGIGGVLAILDNKATLGSGDLVLV